MSDPTCNSCRYWSGQKKDADAQCLSWHSTTSGLYTKREHACGNHIPRKSKMDSFDDASEDWDIAYT